MADATATLTKDQLWELIHEERDRLGTVLDTLRDDEWQQPSLCAGWKVRDVVAHCIETQLMTPPLFLGRMTASGFRFHVMSANNIARHSAQSNSELLAQYHATAHRTSAPPGPKTTWLGEALIHGQDIARPTGHNLQPSPQALTMVAGWLRTTTPLLHGKQRSEGLRLRATDIDWSAGDGPEVSGPAASLILAMAGRSAAISDLSGEGVETLRARL
jgi:uncharacterized protein (TIGR03083 family)